jgi:hypothetical protein
MLGDLPEWQIIRRAVWLIILSGDADNHGEAAPNQGQAGPTYVNAKLWIWFTGVLVPNRRSPVLPGQFLLQLARQPVEGRFVRESTGEHHADRQAVGGLPQWQ